MKKAFTLIELLVVIAVVAILAGLMLPVLSSAKERARVAQCLSNLRQLGHGVALYTSDHNDRFPSDSVLEQDGQTKPTRFTLGGQAPAFVLLPLLPSSKIRPLYPYLGPAQAFQCPKDHGMLIILDPVTSLLAKPTCWDTLGCSYVYNIDFPPTYKTRSPLADLSGLAGKTSGWVPGPSKYILMHEPPAAAVGCESAVGGVHKPAQFHFWHYSGDAGTDVKASDIPNAGRKCVSPLLFVDGHVRFFDFTATIEADPDYVCEPTGDWIWYKPLQ